LRKEIGQVMPFQLWCWWYQDILSWTNFFVRIIRSCGGTLQRKRF